MMANLLHAQSCRTLSFRLHLILGFFFALAAHGSGQALEANPAVPKPAPSPTAPGKITPKPSSLLWAQLTPAQQNALAPLSTEWSTISQNQQQKWLRIADRYPHMKPEEQQRLQNQMKDWVKLTPEQRRIARENYRKIEKLQSEKKQEQWQAYQQLPDEKKQALKTPSVVVKPPVAPATGNVTKSSAAIPTVKSNKPPPKPAAIQKSNQAKSDSLSSSTVPNPAASTPH